MRRIICVILLFTGSINLSGKIINACECKLVDAKKSHEKLATLISTSSTDQLMRDKLYQHYKRIRQEIKTLSDCAEKTRELLEFLSKVHPELSFEVSNLTDKTESSIDIYVEVNAVDLLPERVFGMTSWSNQTDVPDSPQSRYGPGTIRVQIKYCYRRKMARYLVHELAHIKYQSHNLAAYSDYYKQAYQASCMELGHRCDDPSGWLVKQELKRYDLIKKQKTRLELASR